MIKLTDKNIFHRWVPKRPIGANFELFTSTTFKKGKGDFTFTFHLRAEGFQKNNRFK